MGLFGGYQNPGPGINPYAPKKKPFFRYWELLWRNFGKLISLNLIYTLLHAPLFLSLIVYNETNNKLTSLMTIFLLIVQFLIEGATMAGCSRVLRLIVLDKAFFLGEEFKKGFKQNFGAGLAFWSLDAVVLASVLAGHWVYPQLAEQSGNKAAFIPYGISIAVALILLFMNYYIMPLQTATTLKKRAILKNAFMLAGLSLKQCLLTTVCSALMLGIMIFLVLFHSYFMFLLAFFPAAFIGFLAMFMHYPVIQKFVINPYYEESGEENPEAEPEVPEEDRVFTDRGGSEEPVQKQKSKKGKIIS
ncbi:MAG: hypothetical protein IKQ91_01450 [Oscillospiraceae bacterium]|nr:hypothetical protein [Oscillospiraceae bacterium]